MCYLMLHLMLIYLKLNAFNAIGCYTAEYINTDSLCQCCNLYRALIQSDSNRLLVYSLKEPDYIRVIHFEYQATHVALNVFDSQNDLAHKHHLFLNQTKVAICVRFA